MALAKRKLARKRNGRGTRKARKYQVAGRPKNLAPKSSAKERFWQLGEMVDLVAKALGETGDRLAYDTLANLSRVNKMCNTAALGPLYSTFTVCWERNFRRSFMGGAPALRAYELSLLSATDNAIQVRRLNIACEWISNLDVLLGMVHGDRTLATVPLVLETEADLVFKKQADHDNCCVSLSRLIRLESITLTTTAPMLPFLLETIGDACVNLHRLRTLQIVITDGGALYQGGFLPYTDTLGGENGKEVVEPKMYTILRRLKTLQLGGHNCQSVHLNPIFPTILREYLIQTSQLQHLKLADWHDPTGTPALPMGHFTSLTTLDLTAVTIPGTTLARLIANNEALSALKLEIIVLDDDHWSTVFGNIQQRAATIRHLTLASLEYSVTYPGSDYAFKLLEDDVYGPLSTLRPADISAWRNLRDDFAARYRAGSALKLSTGHFLFPPANYKQCAGITRHGVRCAKGKRDAPDEPRLLALYFCYQHANSPHHHLTSWPKTF